MARLPPGFSIQAGPIQAALSEGRTPDAKRLICEILLAGKADAVVQKLAAEMILPPSRPRGRKKALTRHWYEIGEEFHHLRGNGVKYDETHLQIAQKYKCSVSHVRKAVREYDEAREAADEATRESYKEWVQQERTRE